MNNKIVNISNRIVYLGDGISIDSLKSKVLDYNTLSSKVVGNIKSMQQLGLIRVFPVEVYTNKDLKIPEIPVAVETKPVSRSRRTKKED